MAKTKYKQHKVFSKFRRWSGEVPAGLQVDFLGSKSRASYFSMMNSQPKDRYEAPDYPAVDEEYFEWIDLLEAVAWAKGRFIMFELGAGWGRWTARGAAAALQMSIPYSLVAVEAEPTHFEWMVQNLQDNGVRMGDCRLIEAAVTGRDGTVGFQVGDAANSYGQSIGGSVEVQAVSLATLLGPFELVDLIDMDVQGAELEILEAAVIPLQQKVRRVHVETHSRQLHSEIRDLFERIGWRCHCLFEGNSGDVTSFGRINFQSGVQSWLNPALHTKTELQAIGTYRNSLGFRGFEAGRKIFNALAPVGTARRKLGRALIPRRATVSSLAEKFRRDPEDEKLRPVDW